MRTSIPLMTCALLLLGASVRAESEYDAQKSKLKPVRFDSLAELRVVARNYIGKNVEMRGQVKGLFTRGDGIALMIQVAEGENVVVEAPSSFRNATATRPGISSRFLCHVDGTAGNDIALSLIAATNAPETGQLFKTDDDIVVAPIGGALLPLPDQIMIGPDAPRIVTPGGSSLQSRAPATLPSRSMRVTPTPRTAPVQRLAPTQQVAPTSQFRFDGDARASYKALARRSNPKLADDMADTIAGSILAAAQNHSLDPRFLAAIVKVESSFDPYCLSSAGAMGLGQLMPFNLRPLGVGNAWDPAQNLNGAARLLRQNLDTFARQPNGTLLAVAAYHAGVGAVKRAGTQVPQRPATQKYVWKVYYAYRALAPELFQ